jgi:hypothetical protein
VNETHWPKHVLVHYRWSEVAEVDSVAGLYVLFGLGARARASLTKHSRTDVTNACLRRPDAGGGGHEQRRVRAYAAAVQLLR